MVCKYLFKKAVVHWNAPNSYTVMVKVENCNPHWELAFARRGDASWVPLETKAGFIKDIMCSNGRFYALWRDGIVTAYDLSGDAPVAMTVVHAPRPVNVSICPFDSFYNHKGYLAQLPDGRLLLISRFAVGKTNFADDGKPQHFYSTNRLEVYLLEHGRQHAAAKRVEDLGDVSLFLGYNNTLCVSARQHAAAKRNAIYFAEDLGLNYPNNREDMGVYDIGEKLFSSYYPSGSHPPSSCRIWFVPSLLSQGIENQYTNFYSIIMQES